LNELIERLNRIRRENPALQRLANLEFLRTDSEYVVAFLKTTPDGSNRLLVTINLDPHTPRSCVVEVPMPRIGRPYGASYRVIDLLSDQRFIWGEKNYVRLDPSFLPAHILLIENDA
jgi:starch synthase (maltosyl-transferring)